MKRLLLVMAIAVGGSTVVAGSVVATGRANPGPPDRARIPACQVENLDTGVDYTPDLQAALDAVGDDETIQVKGICRGNFIRDERFGDTLRFSIVGKSTARVPVATLDGGTTGRTLLLENVDLTMRSIALEGGSCGPDGTCSGQQAFMFGTSVALTDVTFQNNNGRSGVFLVFGNHTLDRVTVRNMPSSGVAGALVLRRGTGVNAIIRDSVFEGNDTALRVSDPGNVTFEGTNVFRNNEIAIRGVPLSPAVFLVADGASVTFEGNTTNCDPFDLFPACSPPQED